jgi:hypothetical protein
MQLSSHTVIEERRAAAIKHVERSSLPYRRRVKKQWPQTLGLSGEVGDSQFAGSRVLAQGRRQKIARGIPRRRDATNVKMKSMNAPVAPLGSSRDLIRR